MTIIFSTTPVEVKYEVLSYLPINDLNAMARVSKDFHRIAMDLALRIKALGFKTEIEPQQEYTILQTFTDQERKLYRCVKANMAPSTFVSLPPYTSNLEPRLRMEMSGISPAMKKGNKNGELCLYLFYMFNALPPGEFPQVFVIDEKSDPSEINYANRLIQHQPCGRLTLWDNQESERILPNGKSVIELISQELCKLFDEWAKESPWKK